MLLPGVAVKDVDSDSPALRKSPDPHHIWAVWPWAD